MPDPIIFVSHFEVKPGATGDLLRLWSDMVPRLEADKPQTLAYQGYIDADGTRVSIVHVFGTAEAMALHFEGSDERSAAASNVMTPTGWEIYGPAPAPLVDVIRQAAAQAGVPLDLEPVALPGFLRLAPT